MPSLSRLFRFTLAAALLVPASSSIGYSAEVPAAPQPEAASPPHGAQDVGEVELTAPATASTADSKFQQLLVQAVADQDTTLITDLVLQALHTEKVLLRPLEGISSKELLQTAIHLTGKKHDTKNLKRLQAAAEQSGQPELAQQITAMTKLASESRAAEGDAAPELIPILQEDLEAYHSLLNDASRACFVNDQEMIDSIKLDLAKLDWLSDAVKTRITKDIEASSVTAATTSPEVQNVLEKLNASSRQIGRFPKLPAPPTPPTPPLFPPGLPPIPGENPDRTEDAILGRSSVKVYVRNQSSYTISVAYSLKPSSGTWYANNTLQGWAILPPGSSRLLGNNWGPHFYWCAVATTHRNKNLKNPVWWSGDSMKGMVVGTLSAKGFREVQLGKEWRRAGTYTIKID